MLHGARNEMECQGLGRTNLFLVSPRSSRIFGNCTLHKTGKRRDDKIRLNTPRQPTEITVLVRI